MGTFHKTSSEQRAEIVRRYMSGENVKGIARDYGITPPAVFYYARLALAPRRRGGKDNAAKRARSANG
jgi:transposase-like protein